MVILYLMQTRFYVERRRNESGRMQTRKRPVIMSVTFNGQRVMLGTGLKVDLQSWNPDTQRIRSGYPGAVESNNWLDSLKITAQRTWQALESAGTEPDPQEFRQVFRGLKPNYSPGFFHAFYLFMEQESPSWSTSTYRKVRTIYKHLRAFEKERAIKLSFRDLDEAFLKKFQTYYAEKGKKPATIRSAVNILVWYLNWATQKGYNIYHDYRKFYRKLGKPERTREVPVALNWNELMRLKELEPSDRKMERVRDLFCFMCFSGLRFSEMQSLKKGDIDDEWISVRRKGGNERKLPMNRFTRDIYRSYGNRYYLDNAAFPGISIVTMNKYLRRLGEEAGLDRRVPAGEDAADMIPLYEKLTAGMAVHTFIANALELKIPAEFICKFTGVERDRRIGQLLTDLAKREMAKF